MSWKYFVNLTSISKCISVTRRVSLVEQEHLTLPGHRSSSAVFSGVRVAQSLVFCEVFCRSLFVFFLFVVVLTVLQLTASDYPYGVFKLFFHQRGRRGRDRMVVGLTTIYVQSVPITTTVVSSNPVNSEVYLIQHYVIKFVSDLRQVGCFLRVLRFSPPMKLAATL